ncbi:MAG: helix-turn-helix transcriptional regulator [Sulfurimicrobium sp.]|nr:helix-turn-helix transcriptional regulator [Sulfurimicrobium sp.]MDP1705146.1 helix-turn-helix transcriptional regulator [Sulfurimicrobium sp.]MDP2198070.1 helix-turn-helix transcriptional regulator [Sulfurimicrobium sp.]MDP3686885.1 helix-turn-helix transcriptional regulator [Sulfurimicrobium sp.]
MSIGERLKEERERLGHSQEVFAREAGVHRNTQAKYEKGEGVPDANYLAAIESLAADIEYIVTGEKNKWYSSEEVLQRESDLIYFIVEEMENSLAQLNKKLSPSKKAEVVSTLYRSGKDSGKVNINIIKLVTGLTDSK